MVSDGSDLADAAVSMALSLAQAAARELDQITGREVAEPALRASQTTWEAYRAAHCDYVGSTFGGGSGTGIAIRACRISLGRTRVDELKATLP